MSANVNKYRHERNDIYFAKHSYGFGSVGLTPEQVQALRVLTVEQLDALAYVALLGDIHEVALDEDTLGSWAASACKHSEEGDEEAETRMYIVAALVYLSGRLANEIPLLKE